MVGIYKITNPNGKVYIGQSVDLDDRRKDYEANNIRNQTKIYNSIQKYGWTNHTWEILEECEERDLNQRERHYQEMYDVLQNGLNCKLTSASDRSGRYSEESRKKMSEAQKGKRHSEESYRKMGETNRGKKRGPRTEEAKRKMREAWERRRLIPVSEETRKKLSEAGLGQPKSEQARKNMVEAWKIRRETNRKYF